MVSGALIWSRARPRLQEAETNAGPAGMILGDGAVRLWGMSARERLARTYRRAGVSLDGAGATTVLTLGDWVYDEVLVATLAKRPGTVLVTAEGRAVAAHVASEAAALAAVNLKAGRAPAGLKLLSPDELAYNHALRKRSTPVLTELTTDNVRAVEARLFGGSYKGVTDLVTKYVWPVPARIVTRWCAVLRMTPNQVTFVGFLLVLAAFWLFWRGEFGWGLACAWLMTFLDTVDGKLARVTLTSSKIGNAFDHGIDLIHPPFWWWAWWVGLFVVSQPPPWAEAVLLVTVGGYVLQRVQEGIFLGLFRVEIHAWRRFDSFFRLITTRRNPNLILLTLAWLVGRPDVGMVLVAAWTVVSLAVHLVQILQALAAPKGQVVSWLSR